ncbi:MAG: hypothetical protein SGJ18_04195 [Pseudomonadota bacterium]|nr:hypothetical protein [Pseudomonadota bacterium]
MKKVLCFSTLLLTLFLGAACSKSNKRQTLTQRLARGQSAYTNIAQGMVGQLNLNNSGQWGYVTSEPTWQHGFFNTQVQGLMSATVPLSEMGTVDPLAGQKTGVMFQGAVKATVTSGAITNIDLATASLRLVVWDSLAGTSDRDGKIIPEYPIDMIGASSQSNGLNVNLTFSDNYGNIQFIGNVMGARFEGSVFYQNWVSADPGLPKGYQQLGKFSIVACDFFICN